MHPNPIIVMDNVRFHHAQPVVDVVKEYNIEALYIPKYSPELNPIERVFAVVKRRYRKLNHHKKFKNINEVADGIVAVVSEMIDEKVEFKNYYESMTAHIDFAKTHGEVMGTQEERIKFEERFGKNAIPRIIRKKK